MRRLLSALVVGLAATLGTGSRAVAQSDKPAVEVRVPSVLALSEKFEYFGGLFGREEEGKQLAALVRDTAESPMGLDGLDLTKPAGAYAFITKDVVDSAVVVLVPIADEKAALEAVKNKVGLAPKEGEGGVYEMKVPNVHPTVYFRFAEKYAYITVQNPKSIDTASLLKPAAFFAAKSDALLAAAVHVDRLPADVKKTFLGQFELQIAEARKQASPGETEAQGKLREWALDKAVGVVKDVLAEGKTLSVTLAADPKTDDLTTSITFSAVKGSGVAKALSGVGKEAAARKLGGGADPLAAVGVRLGLADGPRTEFAKHVDALLKEVVNNAKGAEQGFVKAALDAVAPTLKAGELDFAFLLDAAGEQGTLTSVSSLKLVEGKQIEKLVKLFAPFAPADKATFKFDVEKVNGVALHQVTVGEPKLEELFGTKTVWIGFSDDVLLVSVEPEGTLIRAAAKGGKGTPGLATAEVSVARATLLADKQLPPEKLKDVVADVFGESKPAGKDTVKLTVEGGDALTVKLVLKGKVVAFLAKLDQAKKQQ